MVRQALSRTAAQYHFRHWSGLPRSSIHTSALEVGRLPTVPTPSDVSDKRGSSCRDTLLECCCFKDSSASKASSDLGPCKLSPPNMSDKLEATAARAVVPHVLAPSAAAARLRPPRVSPGDGWGAQTATGASQATSSEGVHAQAAIAAVAAPPAAAVGTHANRGRRAGSRWPPAMPCVSRHQCLTLCECAGWCCGGLASEPRPSQAAPSLRQSSWAY
eukprot:361131-Chlamydomonas_euryale.AAC.1